MCSSDLTLAELAAHYAAAPPRGEIVVVVGPPAEQTAPDAGDLDTRLDALLEQMSLRDAVAVLVAETGLSRHALYDRALARQRSSQ